VPAATSDPAPTSASTAFKDQIDRALVDRLGRAFVASSPGFDLDRFVAGTERLAAHELKGRISLVARALVAGLPPAFERAVRIVDGVLELPADDPDSQPGGLLGWDLWPVAEWVAVAGRDHPDAALELLARLTRWATGEFAIRPFIDDDPDGVRRRLHRWIDSGDEHVRRLVSEGTRPKLPWAPKLAISGSDPGYAVELLDRLVDDPSEYVRRSVSNHLNDLCRVDPPLALATATRWWSVQLEPPAGAEAVPDRRWVVRRGLRTLVKAGSAEALRLLGHDPDVAVTATLELHTDTVHLGGAAEWTLVVTSGESEPADLVIDYVIHHVRADGSTGPKVTKWSTRTLSPGGRVELTRRHRIRPITTRTYHSGRHVVEVQVNGRVVAQAAFDLIV
jgi:3-methyladenine DNA glycosylase AlkC